jgi:hypothetical protein
MPTNPEYSAAIEKDLTHYKKFLGDWTFEKVPQIRLVTHPILEKAATVLSETPIHWHAMGEYLEKNAAAVISKLSDKRLIALVMELHLASVLHAIMEKVPSFREHSIKDTDSTINFCFLNRVSGSPGIEAYMKKAYPKRFLYTEYDSVSEIAISEKETLPVVWETKLDLMDRTGGDNPGVNTRALKFLTPELRKFWFYPLRENYGVKRFGGVMVVSHNPKIYQNSTVNAFLESGGMVVTLPHENEEIRSEVAKRWLT